MKRVHPTDKHVGNRLRMRRLMLNKSQSEIANALGLTFQQLQMYEKGTNRISASRLQRLCSILQVPVSFFFEGGPQEPKLPALGNDEQSPSHFGRSTQRYFIYAARSAAERQAQGYLQAAEHHAEHIFNFASKQDAQLTLTSCSRRCVAISQDRLEWRHLDQRVA
jgi:transcriptional regulator with XRE-family HTH domain